MPGSLDELLFVALPTPAVNEVVIERAALGRGILATENLTNLGKLPTRGALFIFLCHKWEGATGGLGRAIALLA
jgi:kynurenine formamidase